MNLFIAKENDPSSTVNYFYTKIISHVKKYREKEKERERLVINSVAIILRKLDVKLVEAPSEPSNIAIVARREWTSSLSSWMNSLSVGYEMTDVCDAAKVDVIPRVRSIN